MVRCLESIAQCIREHRRMHNLPGRQRACGGCRRTDFSQFFHLSQSATDQGARPKKQSVSLPASMSPSLT